MISWAATGGRAGIVALTSSIVLVISVAAQSSRGMALLAVREARISPDGSAVVFTLGAADPTTAGAAHASLWRVPFAGGEPDRLAADDCDCAHPRWSPDGRRVAFLSRARPGDPARVRLLPAAGGATEWITDPLTDVLLFEWSPDGRRFAYVGRTPGESAGTSHLWIQDGTMLPVQEGRVGDAESVRSFSWSPTGQAIAVAVRTSRPAARVLTIPMSGSAREISSSLSLVDNIAWAPDGQLIAWLSSEVGTQGTARVLLAPADGGSARTLSSAAGGSAQTLSWPAANRLAIVLGEDRQHHVDVLDVATGARVTVLPPGVADVINAPSWSSDGSRYVVVGSTPEHPAEVFAGSFPQPSPRGSDTVGAPPPPVRRITFSNR